jgi:hypothetical protein
MYVCMYVCMQTHAVQSCMYTNTCIHPVLILVSTYITCIHSLPLHIYTIHRLMSGVCIYMVPIAVLKWACMAATCGVCYEPHVCNIIKQSSASLPSMEHLLHATYEEVLVTVRVTTITLLKAHINSGCIRERTMAKVYLIKIWH